MRSFKKVLKCFAFASIVFIVFSLCDFIFVPSGYIRVILNTLNHSEENYDCIILGASHGRSAVNPYKIDEATGTDAINLCIPSETMKDSYYLLKESCRNNNVNKVILDLDYQYWYDLLENDFSDAFIYYQMEPSKVKLEYFMNNLVKKDFRITFSRWSNYVDDFSKVDEKVSLKLTDGYRNYELSGAVVTGADGPYVGKGFFYREPSGHGGRGLMRDFEWNESSADPEVVGWFDKIAGYCKDNNIELVCITSTITPASVLTGASENSSKFFTELAKKYGVEYYDFNLLRQDVLPRENLDFGDWDGHMCGGLANEYSTILGSVLKDQKEGKLDRTKYFYDSYEDLYNDVNTIMYCETITDVVNMQNGNYKVSFNMDYLTGTGIIPEFKVTLINGQSSRVLSDYSIEKKYSFELPKGEYTLRIDSRAAGSSAGYEEYCEKILDLRD